MPLAPRFEQNSAFLIDLLFHQTTLLHSQRAYFTIFFFQHHPPPPLLLHSNSVQHPPYRPPHLHLYVRFPPTTNKCLHPANAFVTFVFMFDSNSKLLIMYSRCNVSRLLKSCRLPQPRPRVTHPCLRYPNLPRPRDHSFRPHKFLRPRNPVILSYSCTTS